jgi:hypothetical protein
MLRIILLVWIISIAIHLIAKKYEAHQIGRRTNWDLGMVIIFVIIAPYFACCSIGYLLSELKSE